MTDGLNKYTVRILKYIHSINLCRKHYIKNIHIRYIYYIDFLLLIMTEEYSVDLGSCLR